jgi:hypothetical protein
MSMAIMSAAVKNNFHETSGENIWIGIGSHIHTWQILTFMFVLR